MSPEFRSWREFKENPEVSSEVKKAIATFIDSRPIKEKRSILHSGFAFTMNGTIPSKFAAIEDLSEGQQMDAKKKTSQWNLVLGVRHSKRGQRRRAAREEELKDITLDNAQPVKGTHKNMFKYRGKHRSVNRGKGFEAMRRAKTIKGR